jgi:hypothetical protein
MTMAKDDLRARILAGVAAAPARTRTDGRRRAVVAYGLAVLVMGILFELEGGLAHASARPATISAWVVGGTTLLGLAGLWGGVGRGRSMTGRPAIALGLVVLLLPMALFFWLTAWHGSYAEPAQKFGWRCLALTLSMGGSLLASMVMLRHRTVAVQPTMQGAAAGVAAGACASILVDAWCPLVNAEHVLHGHLFPMVALAVVGAACGRWSLAVRPRNLRPPRP